MNSSKSSVFTAILLLLVVSSAASLMSIITYGAGKTGGEPMRVFEICKDNLEFIDEHNSVERSYKVSLNRVADLSHEEYRSMYLGNRTGSWRRLSARKASDRYATVAGKKLPESVGSRERGAVAVVKNQSECKSS